MSIKSITTKYILIGLIILTLMASFTALSFWFTNHIAGDAARINLAGKMRMLNFEMAWLLDKIVREEGEERANTLQHINVEMAIFEGIINSLSEKGKIYDLGPLSHTILVIQHKNISDRWNLKVKPTYMRAVEGYPEAFKEYNNIIHDYINEIDNFVNELEETHTKDIRFYGKLRLAVLGLATLTFLGIILYVRHSLVKPLRIVRTGTTEVRKGNFDTEIKVKSNDEIGILAYEFNMMSRDLKKLYEDLRQKNERLLKLYDVAMSLSDDIPQISNKITSAIAEIFNVRVVSIVEIKGDEGFIISMCKDGDIISSGSFTLKGTPHAQVRIIKDYVYYVEAIKMFPDDPILKEFSLTTYLGIPIVDNKNEVVCILSVMTGQSKDFRREDIEFLHILAKKLSLAIEKRREETEKKVIEAQLFQSQKMEALGTLTAGIAHDFNNLLTGIIGYLELAQAQASEPVKEKINTVLEISERAAQLSKQILLIGRRILPELKPVNVNILIQDSVNMLRRMLEENIEIEVSPQPYLPIVEVDPSQITQVLMNLVLNARDAMPDGGVIKLKTESLYVDEEYCRNYSWAKPGHYVTISVLDTGKGIPEKIRDRIFDPFFTTKDVGKGTGLGLAVTYSVVKNHGGWINFYSEEGKGTEFKAYIPAMDLGHDVSISEGLSGAETLPGGTETILLVDDEPIIRGIGGSILQRLGYTVITASDGKEGVEIFKERSDEIALVILDKVMPVMSGIEAYRILKEINPEARIILSSGHAIDDAQTLRDSGISGFLSKPYRTADMAKTVREAIDN